MEMESDGDVAEAVTGPASTRMVEHAPSPAPALTSSRMSAAPAAGGPVRVRNKAPSAIQISAEQLLREAWENREERDDSGIETNRQVLLKDASEVAHYQRKEREKWERRLAHSHSFVGLWVRYARWEEGQRDLVRARSVYERALDTHARVASVWLAYAEMETKAGFVNHARNVLDRAVSTLPGDAQIWSRYAVLEQVLREPTRARAVFWRWMAWRPSDNAWSLFVSFELRQGNEQGAREVLETYVSRIPRATAFLRYAAFEEQLGNVNAARGVFERMIRHLPQVEVTSREVIAFAQFETRAKELTRARAIFVGALEIFAAACSSKSPSETTSEPDHLAHAEYDTLMEAYAQFEKQFGERESTEALLVEKRASEYERNLARTPSDAEAWFDYLRMLEQAYDAQLAQKAKWQGGVTAERIRACFERAVACISKALRSENHKSVRWRRYIYLWIKYAVWEESLEPEQVQNQVGSSTPGRERAREVYRRALRRVPHSQFSSGKLWLLAAQLELRRHELSAARRLFGQALGYCASKARVYREYISLELALGELPRCRTIHEKWIENLPGSALAWTEYARFEIAMHETERARALLEIALSRKDILDSPQSLWKIYIDFEVELGETEQARKLYEGLIQHYAQQPFGSQLVQALADVFLSYAAFEQQVGEEESGTGRSGSNLLSHLPAKPHPGSETGRRVRCVFRRADEAMEELAKRAANQQEDETQLDRNSATATDALWVAKKARAGILDTWLEFETRSVLGDASVVESELEPKRPRLIMYESKQDYVFGDGGSAEPGAKAPVAVAEKGGQEIRSGEGATTADCPASPQRRGSAQDSASGLVSLARAWKRARTSDG
ncbi:Protein crooked neck [Porphyridium purpureum]|uniref:Protein crooked neck n=1 Tax=Porphyridium purpureum TaxID=35688 RepID=A0A5J4Z380_PORPP|nr:Protein crooked neck [Porphyridium purpureum]|eukprot:POR5919..scf295_1